MSSGRARLLAGLSPILLSLLWVGLAAASAIEIYEFADEVEERRFQALSQELRCTVCQNQSLADSDAPLARDLRRQVYEMIRAGRADMEIRQFMVDRYGEFVLYRPPIASHTLLLWGGPLILLLGGLIAAGVVINRRRKAL
ncbi:cytochrome c-type biogenesis protein [Wenzhouxiangella marina]|uniref:Cytochrome c-type biogenesis protein n=1 Tax=Wenzhouxiangella marina TaxID=1579979 RepID=A0A0K0XXU8_9GAMM|nr:cytochrome c-type biogenesis protein [Wenzhouxiangella marina]AKS42508.1 Cytochrome c-type biogenesis protein CcmH [Wenzhouxiangella marina]MBB6085716.1 cytochrome c-type biogenesis protein CcmH [Wenzhouxiangella marina]